MIEVGNEIPLDFILVQRAQESRHRDEGKGAG
jgi:hypothetical protein